ncbi:MAG: FtsX-like permease family protein [Bacteroidales bacterium]|jgi:ABC-type lipoprotein release transport system permease subunit|nr:FtsX-like permease family protein [Bacteroidales bacterium]MCU0407668.1 FtsX-like permease family protein [Bacteroidales bacterium]
MIIKTAWKNVWRNKVRSFVVIASVTVGVFSAVFSVAVMNGMIAQRVNAALDEEISHIQVSAKGFSLNQDPDLVISDAAAVEKVISGIPGIAGHVRRTIVSGMAGTATKSAGVEISGINPEEEKTIFSLDKKIITGTGSFFDGDSRPDLALIGQDLARDLNIIRYSVDSLVLGKLREENVPAPVLEKLNTLSGERFANEKKFTRRVKTLLSARETARYGHIIKEAAWSFREGSRFTLTFLDRNEVQVGARFRITGIYDTKNSMFESTQVFVRAADLRKYTGMSESDCHKIIMRLDDSDMTVQTTESLAKALPGLDVTNWKKLQPDLALMTDYVHQIYGILFAIILAALAFGIVNTMLMVVLERTRELGMLTAIGMNKRKVFSMIMLESVFLSLTGGAAGMLAGWIAILLTARNGINFVKYAEGLEAFGYSAHLYPEISFSFFIMATILIIITGILSSVYPAFKALKLNPVEAIRTE